MIHKYTVFGNPIAQSQSPEIHALFAEQTHREIEYTKTLADRDSFVSMVEAFVRSGASGFNVTAPFKQDILDLCDQLSAAAKRANAVNTVKVGKDGMLSGYNTDGSGLLTDLVENNKINIRAARILIAGAGGATRGILMPLLEESPAQLVVVNRTLSKAQALATDFADCGEVIPCNYDSLPAGKFDLVINATSLSLRNEKPPLPETCIGPQTVAYDLSYGKDTEFMQWVRNAGAASTLDGFGMLLEQAADAFFIWEEVRPKTRLVALKL